MTRAKKLAVMFFTLCLLLTLFSTTAFAADPADFSDMPKAGFWSYEAVTAAVENGLLHGSGGKLYPENNLTRAEMATIINRAFGATETADISAYTDVATAAWYYSDIGKAVKMGTFYGDSSGTMRPNDSITREEAFAVIARAFKLSGGSESALDKFSDKGKISNWAKDALASLAAADYIQGSGGQLNPKEYISRQEFAQLMFNILKNYLSAAGTYTEVASGNVMVNAAGVTLKDLTVSGDLVIGDGVGNGNISLDNVEITGRLVVRGGGENSILITGASDLGSIIISKTASGAVRIKTEDGCSVEMVYVDDGSDDVILEGTFNNIAIDAAVPTVLRDATVANLSVTAAGADVKLEGLTAVMSAEIGDTAIGSDIEVTKDAIITALASSAEDVSVRGAGIVLGAVISGNDTSIDTTDTVLTVAAGTSGVTENGQAVPSGTEDITTGTGTTPGPRDVASFTAFKVANGSAYVTAIQVTGDFTITEDITVTKDVTVASGSTLTVAAGVDLLTELADGFTNNGTIQVDGCFALGATDLTNAGSITVRADGELGVYMATLTNTGTFTVAASGEIEMDRGGQFVNGSALTNNGTVTVTDNGGGLTNNGSGTITNNGTINTNGYFTNNGTLSVATGAHMLIGTGNTSVNGGTMQVNGTVEIDDVTMDNNSGGSITVGINGTLAVQGGTLINAGTIDVIGSTIIELENSNNGVLILTDDGVLTNTGAVTLEPTTVDDPIPQQTDGGALVLESGTFNNTGAVIFAAGGGLKDGGFGWIVGTFNNNAGGTVTVSGLDLIIGQEGVGSFLNNSGAILTVNSQLHIRTQGSLTNASGGTVNNNGVVNAVGSCTNNGTWNGYDPTV